jgi:hypothetical protein
MPFSGLIWGGVQYPWLGFQTLLPIFLGIAGIIATILWKWEFTKNPFSRLGWFENRSAVSLYVCAVVQGLIVSPIFHKIISKLVIKLKIRPL